MPGRIMVMLVCTGALLGAVGIYGPFSKWAGAGANVPLLGFGNVLWKGVKEAVDSEGFIGLFKGGFKACAVGVSAALIFSYIAALITKPKLKSSIDFDGDFRVNMYRKRETNTETVEKILRLIQPILL